MVNPKAKIYMNWFSASWYDDQLPFEDPEIRVICNRDITAPKYDARDVGLYLRQGRRIINMATLIPRWGLFYRLISEMILKGTFNPAEAERHQLLVGHRIPDPGCRFLKTFRSLCRPNHSSFQSGTEGRNLHALRGRNPGSERCSPL